MRSTCLLDGLAYIYMIALNRKEKICLAIILAISRKRQKKTTGWTLGRDRKGRRNWPAARNLRFCRTSHEHHTNVTRTFSE